MREDVDLVAANPVVLGSSAFWNESRWKSAVGCTYPRVSRDLNVDRFAIEYE